MVLTKRNHIEGCFVHRLDESAFFICLAQEQDKDTCPHSASIGFLDVFCTHPDRYKFPRKHLSEVPPRRPDNSSSSSNQ
jgi:hypothetical protein